MSLTMFAISLTTGGSRTDGSRARPGMRRRLALPAAGLLVGVLLLGTAPAPAQISPGPLSRAHADLEGTLSCLKCHGGRQTSLDANCLDCHKAIARLIQEKRGLHGHQETEGCAHCHPEHAGVDFELIVWEEGSPERFDHARSGWPLEGKHAERPCRDCHKPEFQKGPIAELLEVGARNGSWLGLDPDCRSCHEDIHRDALGGDCRRCHGMASWKPAPRFDHQKTAFPLVGKHVPVDCARCHLNPALPLHNDASGKAVPIYRPVPHQECSACHDDPHRGRLGAGCAACHQATAWKQVNRQEFDHARTRFPLRGKHAPLPCEVCHDPQKAWGKKPPMEACSGCHRDPHAGKATLAGKPVDCAACHDERGFRPATYTVESHDTAPYPLQGKHRALKCDACHPKNVEGMSATEVGTAGVLLRRPHEHCLDCHVDAHGGQLASRPDGGACESCHGVEGWKPSHYLAADHAALGLPLEGRHAAVSCSACHGPERPGLPPFPAAFGLGTARVALSILPTGCDTCHVDPHGGVFQPAGERSRQDGCRSCHDVQRFVPSTMDVAAHEKSRFPLRGAHRAVPCGECHEELRVPPSGVKLILSDVPPRELRFRVRHDRCADCHDTPHGEQFALRADGGACDGCHDENGFRPAPRFDHSLARFRLEGRHVGVSCDKCHPTVGETAQVVYRPVPHECQDCHRDRTFAPEELSGGR